VTKFWPPGACEIPCGACENSVCVFSGLEDGEKFPDQPAGPGAPPQSWGQIQKEVRDPLALEGAHPGDACNGHTGFFAGGGGELAQLEKRLGPGAVIRGLRDDPFADLSPCQS
jgi:hypothetical protein